MLGRVLILVVMVLFGPLYAEIYLYHPLIALEHDPVAIVPRVASAVALATGFLLLAADNKATVVLFAGACAINIAVGVVGTAIHLAMHASLIELFTTAGAWLGNPPPLVPLTFAAGGCLGLIPLVLAQTRRLEPVAFARNQSPFIPAQVGIQSNERGFSRSSPESPLSRGRAVDEQMRTTLDAAPAAIARILYALGALGGLVAAVAGSLLEGGDIGLIAILAGLGLGSFGFLAEIAALLYPLLLPLLRRSASRPT